MPPLDLNKFKLKGGAQKPLDLASFKTPQQVTPLPQSIAGSIGTAAKDVGIGALKGVVGTVRGIGTMGQAFADQTAGRVVNAVGGKGFTTTSEDNALNTGSPQGEGVSEALKAKNPAQFGGKALELAAEFFMPIGEVAKAGKLPEIIANSAKASAYFGKKVVLGRDALKTLEQIGDKEAQKFAKGKTVNDVSKFVNQAIGKFESTSKAALQAVKNRIPNIQVDPSEVAKKINDAILSSIHRIGEYRGVTDASLFKTPEDLINSGIMNPEEAQKVKGMVDAMKNWKDYSARGILNLKEQLAPFYKAELNNSNAVLRNIQNSLKEVVGEAHPPIKGALKTASQNIDKAEEFTRHLIGRDVVSGEAKLSSIARALKNPASNAEKIKLLKELKDATGFNVLPQLKGYANFLKLLEKDLPSKTGTILKAAGTRLGIAGGITAAGAEAKNLLGF